MLEIMKKKDAQKAIAALQKFIDGQPITFEEVQLVQQLHGELEWQYVPSDINGMDETCF